MAALGISTLNPFAVLSGAATIYNELKPVDLDSRLEDIDREMIEKKQVLYRHNEEIHMQEALENHRSEESIGRIMKENNVTHGGDTIPNQADTSKGYFNTAKNLIGSAAVGITAWFSRTKEQKQQVVIDKAKTNKATVSKTKQKPLHGFGTAAVYDDSQRLTGSDVVIKTGFNSWYKKPTRDLREAKGDYERPLLSIYRKWNGEGPVTNRQVKKWYYGKCVKDPQCLKYRDTGEMY